MSWYSTGYEGASAAAKKSDNNRKIPRFWMPSGVSKELIFIDDVCFAIDEHNLKINGNWGNYYTCLGKETGCPYCQLGDPKYTGFFTVLDLTGYIDKKGQVQDKNTVKLLAAHAKVVETIESLKKMRDNQSLIACRFRVSRKNTKNDFSTGSSFEFLQAYDPQQLLAKYQAYDYVDLLKPWDRSSATNLVSRIMGHIPNSNGPMYNAAPQQQQPQNQQQGSPVGQPGVEGCPSLDDIPF